MTDQSTAVQAAAARICEVVRRDEARGWLQDYFDPRGNYAAELFNSALPNEVNSVDPADLFAVGLLSVNIDARRTRHILHHQRAEISQLLRQIPVTMTIADAPPYPEGRAWEAAEQLFDLLRGGWNGRGNAAVIAGKIMARKRPHLIPITDSVVMRIVDAPPRQFWRSVQCAFLMEDLTSRLEELRGDVPSLEPLSQPLTVSDVSTLRLLDVILWQWGKRAGG